MSLLPSTRSNPRQVELIVFTPYLSSWPREEEKNERKAFQGHQQRRRLLRLYPRSTTFCSRSAADTCFLFWFLFCHWFLEWVVLLLLVVFVGLVDGRPGSMRVGNGGWNRRFRWRRQTAVNCLCGSSIRTIARRFVRSLTVTQERSS